MKNAVITILAPVVLSLGGWIAYDQLNKTPSDSGASSSGGTSYQTSGRTLDLSNREITEVGPDIYNSNGVTKLVLSGNHLKSLKSEMGRMTSLEILLLDHNQIEGSLIGEIRKMPLKTLDASYNKMTGIPAEIGQVTTLETLNYSYNKLTGLPNELANLKNNLKTFDLTGNPLSQDTLSKIRASLPGTNIIF